MKITKKQLKQIIKEEYDAAIVEQEAVLDPRTLELGAGEKRQMAGTVQSSRWIHEALANNRNKIKTLETLVKNLVSAMDAVKKRMKQQHEEQVSTLEVIEQVAGKKLFTKDPKTGALQFVQSAAEDEPFEAIAPIATPAGRMSTSIKKTRRKR
jgi:chromosome segregation ATPase